MQKHTISLLILGALFGGFVTYGLMVQTGAVGGDHHDEVAHDHEDDDGDAHDHGEELAVDNAIAPSLSIDSARISGGNNVDLNVSWENFRMAPENADGDHVDGEGHLHVYVDGEKIGRMYGQWYHVFDLTPGEHVIEVTATTNDHRLYTTDDEEIAATTSVTIQ